MGYEQERRREEKCGERNVMGIMRIGIDYGRLDKFYKSNSEVRIIFFSVVSLIKQICFEIYK